MPDENMASEQPAEQEPQVQPNEVPAQDPQQEQDSQPEGEQQEQGAEEERVLGDGARGDVEDPAQRPEPTEHVQMEGTTSAGEVPSTEPVSVPEQAAEAVPAVPAAPAVTVNEKTVEKGVQR